MPLIPDGQPYIYVDYADLPVGVYSSHKQEIEITPIQSELCRQETFPACLHMNDLDSLTNEQITHVRKQTAAYYSGHIAFPWDYNIAKLKAGA